MHAVQTAFRILLLILATLLPASLHAQPSPATVDVAFDPNPITFDTSASAILRVSYAVQVNVDSIQSVITADQADFFGTVGTNDCGAQTSFSSGTGFQINFGQLAASTVCTVEIAVSPSSATDVSVSVESTIDPASSTPVNDVSGATLTVNEVPATDPYLTSRFAPDNQARTGDIVELVTRLGQGTGSAFTYNLQFAFPSGLSPLDGSIVTDCENLVRAEVSGNSVEVQGGTTADCSISIRATATSTGLSQVEISGTLTGSSGFGTLAAPVLSVAPVTGGVASSLSVSPSTVRNGSGFGLTFILTSTSRSATTTGITFDLDIPGGLDASIVAAPASPCGAGSSVTAASAGSPVGTLSLDAGQLAPGASCTFTVDLETTGTTTPGGYVLEVDRVDFTVDSDTSTVPGPSAFLRVQPAAQVAVDLQATNSPVSPGTPLDLQIDFSAPTGPPDVGDVNLVVAIEGESLIGGTTTSCGLTIFMGTSPSGGSQINITGTLTTDCVPMFRLDTTGLPAGPRSLPISGTVRSSSGDTVEAAFSPASYTVTAAGDLDYRFSAQPETVAAGSDATLTYEFDNRTAFDLTGASFSHAVISQLPAGASISSTTTTCASPVNNSDTSTIAYGFTVAPETSCTVTAVVSTPADASGTSTLQPGNLTGMLDGSSVSRPANSADLTIISAAAPSVAISALNGPFTPGSDSSVSGAYTTQVVFTGNGSEGALFGTVIGFTDQITPGSSPVSDCGGVFSANGGANGFTFNNGTVPASGNCTLSLPFAVDGDAGEAQSATVSANVTVGGDSFALPVRSAAIDIAPFDLTASVSVSPRVIAPGDRVTVTITSNNAATETDHDLDFATDPFGTGITVLSTSESCGFVTGSVTSGTLGIDGRPHPVSTCTTSIEFDLPANATPGPKTLASTLHQVTAGTDTILLSRVSTTFQVVTAVPEGTVSAIFQGPSKASGTALISYTITNTSTETALERLRFVDPMSGDFEFSTITPTRASGACGPASILTGGDALTLSGGAIAPGGSCTFTASITVPGGTAGSTLTNLTGTLLEDTIEVSSGTTATLSVDPAPTQTVSIADASVEVGQSTTARLSISAAGTSLATFDIAAALSLDAELSIDGPVDNSCGGTVTVVGDALSLTGGAIPADGSCRIDVPIVANTTGTPSVNATTLTSNGGSAPATAASLTVTPAILAPVVTAAYDPTNVPVGGTSELTIDISNAGNPVPASNVVLQSGFAGLGADPSVVSSTCARSDMAASGAVALGDIAAGASCVVTLSLTFTEDGTLDSTINVVSDLGASDPATAQITVFSASAPVVSASFDPETIPLNAETTLAIQIDNSAALVAASDLSFDQPLSDGFALGSDPLIGDTCGGTLTVTADASGFTYADGTLDAGATCVLSVRMQGTATGTRTADLTLSSSLGTSATAQASLTVGAAPQPTATLDIEDDILGQGELTNLVIEIDNTASLADDPTLNVSGTVSSGLTLRPDLAVANTCDGSLAVDASTGTFTLTGGTVGQSDTCAITLQIEAVETGSFDAAATLATSRGVFADLSDTVIVTEAPLPQLLLSIDPMTISRGDSAVLTLTVDNTAAAIPVEDITIDQQISDALILSGIDSIASTCGGTIVLNSLGGFTLTGGVVAARSSCQIVVSLRAVANGAPELSAAFSSSRNPTVFVTSLPGVTIVDPPVPVFTADYSPDDIIAGNTTNLIFTLDNTGAALPATDAAFSGTLPTGLVVQGLATSDCGGVLDAEGPAFSLTGGTIPPNDICQVTIPVLAAVAGNFGPPVTGDLTSSLGTSGGLSNAPQLAVAANPVGTLTIIQQTDTDGTFGFASAQGGFDLSVSTVDGAGQVGPIDLAPGTYVISQTTPDGTGTQSISCNDDDSTSIPSDGVLSANIAAGEALVCTFTSIASRQATVDAINKFLTKRANLIVSSEPSSARRIDRLNRGFGTSTRLQFQQGNVTSMMPVTFDPRSIGSGNYAISTSLVQIRRAAASVQLMHGDLDGTAYVPNTRWDIWFEAQYKTFDEGDDNDGNFAIGYLGADYIVNKTLLVGALVQFDKLIDKNSATGSRVEGEGWLIGPYLTAKLAPNLYLDARIAAGRSSNRISPFGTYTDDFDTTRWLANASLSGQFERGNWTIRPTAALSWWEEKQDSYTDALGVDIPSQTVSLGQLRIGPSFTGRFAGADGAIYVPTIELDALWNFGDTDGVTLSDPDDSQTDGLRGRIKAGVTMNTASGATYTVTGSYDGIGQSDFEAWGIGINVDIPF